MTSSGVIYTIVSWSSSVLFIFVMHGSRPLLWKIRKEGSSRRMASEISVQLLEKRDQDRQRKMSHISTTCYCTRTMSCTGRKKQCHPCLTISRHSLGSGIVVHGLPRLSTSWHCADCRIQLNLASKPGTLICRHLSLLAFVAVIALICRLSPSHYCPDIQNIIKARYVID